MDSMLTKHRDDSECPRFRFRSGCDTLRSVHRDHSSACRRGYAALSEASAAHAVDQEAIFQVVRDWSVSHFSIPPAYLCSFSFLESFVRRTNMSKAIEIKMLSIAHSFSTARAGRQLCFCTLRIRTENVISVTMHS